MTHYSILVKLPYSAVERRMLDDVLAERMLPYKEYGCGDPDNEQFVGKYCEFVDETEELSEKYENEGAEHVEMPDGRLLLPWDDEFRKEDSPPGCFGPDTHEVPEHLTERHVPFKERYSTFEEFVKDWCGRDPEQIGYWHNPNSKWDWYQVGGRWKGSIRIKPECEEAVKELFPQGEPSWTNEGQEVDPLMVDVCRVGDIDFAWYSEMAKSKALRRWKELNDWKARGFTEESYKELGLGGESGLGPNPFTGFCGFLHSLKLLLPFTDEEREELEQAVKVKDVGKDEFMRLVASANGLTAWAVVDDQGWHESGEMGWFGCSGDTPEERSDFINSFYQRFFADEDPSTVIVRVDCHI